jgi:hypothetical protein
MMKPGETDRWPRPGTPPPTGPARVWIEVELAIAQGRLERLLKEGVPPPPPTGKVDADD